MKVGPPEFGYDGLHILDDGTFVATRGGPFANDSVLWEIDQTPDSLGVVPIQLIPLTFDTLIVGNLNGLEAGSAQGSPTLMLDVDTTFLRPWLDSANYPSSPDTLYSQDDRVGDSASVTITYLVGGVPDANATVVVTAELRPQGGGHSHQTDPITFGELPTESYAAGGPRPIGGYFKQGSTRYDSIVATADSLGQVAFTFVAGFLGGRVDLIVDATAAAGPWRILHRAEGAASLRLHVVCGQ
jgi:hypothetical protein